MKYTVYTRILFVVMTSFSEILFLLGHPFSMYAQKGEGGLTHPSMNAKFEKSTVACTL